MRAYIMVIDKAASFSSNREIRERLRLECSEVLGIYDTVVQVNVEDVQDLWGNYISPINEIPVVGSCTTYLAVKESPIKPIEGSPLAFVLIDATPKDLTSVWNELSQVGQVRKADIVLGPFDIIAEIVVQGMEQLGLVLDRVLAIPGITRTVTLVRYPHPAE